MIVPPGELEQVTNRGFLLHLFREGFPDELFVSTIPGDPAAPGPRGYPSWEGPVADLPVDQNNFFCVSSLRRGPDGRLRRSALNFAALHVLVVDDVRQKVEPARVESLLGRPSYILQTSPGSEQWGYALRRPEEDRGTALALINGLGRTLGIHDMKGLTRVARLPQAINGKPKYRESPGDPPPPCRLKYFDTDRWVEVEDLLRVLDTEPEDWHDPAGEPFLPAHADPVIAALSAAGLDPRPSAESGKYHITCPWVEEHTDQRDDGAAYLAPSGFHCFHGHCAGRTFWDLREALGLSVEEIERARAEAAFADEDTEESLVQGGVTEAAESDGTVPAASDSPSEQETTGSDPDVSEDSPDGRIGESSPPSSPEPEFSDQGSGEEYAFPVEAIADDWCGATFADLLTESGEVRWAQIPEREWLMHELIQLNAPWYIAGEGGVGKSRLGLAICMAIASGKPFGGFIPDPAGHPVIFLSQEDDEIDRQWRFATQFERWVDREGDWSPDEIKRLRENLMMPQLRWGQKADETVREVIKLVSERKGEVRLVLWDPLILFWDEGSRGENSINTAAGAIATFRKLIDASKADGAHWSAGMLHHLNREGETYGSAMLTAQARACFRMTLEEQGVGMDTRRVTRIELVKVNSSPRLGWSEEYEMHAVNGSLWTADEHWFGTDAELVSALLRSGEVPWDQSHSKIAEQCSRNAAISGEKREHRMAAVRDVLRDWGRLEEDELASQLEDVFGLRRIGSGSRCRFEPIEGFVVRGDDAEGEE